MLRIVSKIGCYTKETSYSFDKWSFLYNTNQKKQRKIESGERILLCVKNYTCHEIFKVKCENGIDY